MKGTTQTLRQRRQGLHFFHNQVVFLILESHFHNSMSSICAHFSIPVGEKCEVVEEGYLYEITTLFHLVFCPKIPYSVIGIIIVKF
jgi:hypothetical protein